MRPFKKINMELFRKDIETMVINIVDSNDNFESTYKQFKDEAKSVLDDHCPEQIRKVKKNNKPKWIDAEFEKARAERRKRERKWRKSKVEGDYQQYKEQRNLCAKLAISKQEQHYTQVIDKAENKQKSLFQVVDKLLDKKDERILPAHTDPVDLANKFNGYYIEKIDKLRKSIPETNEYHHQQQRQKFNGTKLSIFAPTTAEEVKEILKDKGIKTSSEDPLPVDILKEVTDEMIPALVVLVNMSLSEGSMNGIKSSVIDPLLKKLGLDSEIYKNFRPVNNLVFLSKLVERIVNKRIDAHMAENNLHNKKAFGYKSGHNTETMMLGVTNDVLAGFDENMCTVMLFLDLSAPFDTIMLTSYWLYSMKKLVLRRGKLWSGAAHSSKIALKELRSTRSIRRNWRSNMDLSKDRYWDLNSSTFMFDPSRKSFRKIILKRVLSLMTRMAVKCSPYRFNTTC